MAPKCVKKIHESCKEKIRGKVFHESTSHSSTDVGDVKTYVREASLSSLSTAATRSFEGISELSAVLLLYVQDSWYFIKLIFRQSF